jgi:hypothetical protein
LYELATLEEKNEFSYYIPTPSSHASLLGLLPDNHILAAEVDVVKGSGVTRHPLDARFQKIGHGISSYRALADRGPEPVRPLQLADVATRQCMVESMPAPGEEVSGYYVDIDARFL